jgi:hypothetical protein
MSESNPLVERVDALLKRHQRPQEVSTPSTAAPGTRPDEGAGEPATPTVDALGLSDDDVPVLTEIVDAQSIPAPPAYGRDFASGIEDAVLEKILAELDRSLEHRLNRTIGDLLEQMLDGLRAELSAGIREMVRDAVAAAVAREIARRERAS